MSFEIVQGDALSVLQTLPEASVHCCVTSPPYWGLRDYGTPGQIGLEKTPEEYVRTMVEVFREVRRVLRKDGTLWLNLGDSYASSSTYNTTNTLHSVNGWKQDGSKRPNAGIPLGLKPKDLCMIPARVALALQADGWWLRSDIIWHKRNPMPESVTDRPTKSHEYIFLLSKSAKYYYDANSVREPTKPDPRDKRWNQTRQTSRHDHSHDAERGMMQYRTQKDGFVRMSNPAGRNKRSVWTVATYPVKDAHFATYPPDLIEPCILAGCPPHGTVLDPFAGSGTTGLVAIQHGRRFLGLCAPVEKPVELLTNTGDPTHV